MLDEFLRPLKDRVLLPLAMRLPFSPNTITLSAFFIGLCAVSASFLNFPYLAFVLWILNRIIDGLDGLVARHTHTQSDFGGFLDLICDFFVYATLPSATMVGVIGTTEALYVAIAYLISFSLNSTCLFLVSATLLKKEMAQGSPTSVPLPTGYMEGAETIFAFSLMLAVPTYAVYTLSFFTVCIYATIVQRCVWSYRHL